MTLIAITASSQRETHAYTDSITRRGGLVRILLSTEWDGTAKYLNGAQGLMLTGGEDIHPSSYGQVIDANCLEETSITRDRMELTLLHQALSLNLPVLGICRGMQIMNIFFGGSLIQHLPYHRPDYQESDELPYLRHSVYVSPGSKLAAVVGVGAFYRTNSWHHQGVKEAQKAPSLLASSYAPDDGVIEALESPAHSWAIGVQCHPEREHEVAKGFLNLFDGFLDWASHNSQY